MAVSMALNHLPAPSLSICTFSGLNQPRNQLSLMPLRKEFVPCPIKCQIVEDKTIIRRSANFQRSIWDDNYIQSLKSDYMGEQYVEQSNEMKMNVKMMLDNTVDHVQQLELIDTLQRLGVSYHFKEEIQRMIQGIYDNTYRHNSWKNRRDLNLYSTALEFRILRQHGYKISQDVFSGFQDEMGNFKGCISDDIKGMLHLYEATFLMVGGETILEDARNFTSVYLKHFVKQKQDDQDGVLYELVSHALELPLHWRLLRIEARWFIDVYERTKGMNPSILQFAKLDFNMVQAIHQEDLKYDSRWWTSSGLPEKLWFTRDRLMENFLWGVGLGFEPHFGYMRRMNTKIHQLLTTVDDVYDIYGTLDELERFTDVIQRWDIDAMEQLPDCMKMTFFTVYNAMNETGFTALKEQGFNVLPCLKKVWGDLGKRYLLEAKWFYSGYKPSLEEYLENGWISITGPAILIHAYLVSSPLSKEVLEILPEYPDIIRHPSMIIRLADDLGTSSDEIKRGDNPKSIQCYMNETGASEEEAREHIHYLISETWKKINEEYLDENSPWPPIFKEIAINIARTAQAMYLYGDGHASQDHKVQARMESLFVKPIP